MTTNRWSGNTGISSRKFKTVARSMAMAGLCAKQSALMLPSAEMECVQRAIDSGIFNKKTTCICVERNKSRFKNMEQMAESLPISCECENKELHEVALHKPIDYAFIDLNGQITREVSRWCAGHLCRWLSDGADIVFSFLFATRNNPFIKSMISKLRRCPETADLIYSISSTRVIDEPVILTYCALLNCIFEPFSFRMDTPVKYRDTQSMLLFRLTNLRRKPNYAPSAVRKFLFANLGIEHRTPAIRQTATVLSRGHLAALKAWETRRKNKKMAI